jgi:hypothetical protein
LCRSPQEEAPGNPRDRRRGEDAELCGVQECRAWRVGREGEAGDEERHRKPDAAENRDAGERHPGRALGQGGYAESYSKPREAGDAQRLADEQSQRRAQRDRAGQRAPLSLDEGPPTYACRA